MKLVRLQGVRTWHPFYCWLRRMEDRRGPRPGMIAVPTDGRGGRRRGRHPLSGDSQASPMAVDAAFTTFTQLAPPELVEQVAQATFHRLLRPLDTADPLHPCRLLTMMT